MYVIYVIMPSFCQRAIFQFEPKNVSKVKIILIRKKVNIMNIESVKTMSI